MMKRLRLIDAVAIAAAALLCLKLVSMASVGSRASDAREDTVDVGVEQSQVFARALAKARTNYEPPDVLTTNAVKKPGGAAEGQKGPDTQKPDRPLQSAGEEAMAATVPPSPSERAILERLGERREEWQQKGKDLDLRARMLEDAERKLEARINELKAIEERNESAATKRGDGEAGALKNLVTMYETMKPKEAARVFDRLPHDVLVPVVLQMNPRKMAEVLAVMSPEAAERLTVALATRARGRLESASAPAGLPPGELPAIDPPARP